MVCQENLEVPEGMLPCAQYNINVSCRITYNKSEYEHSDLVAFHVRGLLITQNFCHSNSYSTCLCVVFVWRLTERGAAAPFACHGHFLILMRFIDPRIFDSNDIHRPHPGPQENLQIGGVRCAISQIWPKFREMLGENPADIHL